MKAAEGNKGPELVRALGLWSAIAVVIGGMIGQSVFLVASDMARELGSVTGVLAAWVIGGVVVLFGAFCYGELGAALPEAGGEYVIFRPGTQPCLGIFVYGWRSSIIMKPGAAAVIAAGFLRFTTFLLPAVATPLFTWHFAIPFQSQGYQFTFTAAQPLAAAIIVVVTAINYVGVRTAGHFHTSYLAQGNGPGRNRDSRSNTRKVCRNRSHADYIARHVGIGAFLTALVPAMSAYNGFQALGPLRRRDIQSATEYPAGSDPRLTGSGQPLRSHQLDLLSHPRIFPSSTVAIRRFSRHGAGHWQHRCQVDDDRHDRVCLSARSMSIS